MINFSFSKTYFLRLGKYLSYLLFIYLFHIDILSWLSVYKLYADVEKETTFSNTLTPQSDIQINVMGPLTIGDPSDPHGINSNASWNEFEDSLKILKEKGVTAISTDVWWGLAEKKPGEFNWEYYKKLAKIIKNSGLKWVPIMSFHQLGGNVGDNDGNSEKIPIPDWVWDLYAKDPVNFKNRNDLMYKSEQNNFNSEHVSPFATDLVIEEYMRFMNSFKETFVDYADIISEINISLGPAGELRYPSYNSVDKNSGYPERGVLMCYTNSAKLSFRNYLQLRFKTIAQLNEQLETSFSSFDDIQPPNPSQDKTFWPENKQFSKFGKVFFDWYDNALITSGRKTLEAAAKVFGESTSPYKNAYLGAKIPGIHWRAGSDRAAEFTSGEINPSNKNFKPENNYKSENPGSEYTDILSTFSPTIGGMKFVVHYTAVEMDDGNEIPTNLPHTLSKNISKVAQRMKLEIRGENALGSLLYHPKAWDNLFHAITVNGFKAITLLRSDAITKNKMLLDYLGNFLNKVKAWARPNSCKAHYSSNG